MTEKRIVFFFYNITCAVMTLLTISSIYILQFILTIETNPEYALYSYHSYPILLENILAGIAVYLIFGFLFIKIWHD